MLWFGIYEQQKVMFICIAAVPFILADAPLALPDIFRSLRSLFGLALGYIFLAGYSSPTLRPPQLSEREFSIAWETPMTRPFINLDEVEFTDIEDNGYYTSRRAQFSAGIGARKLGYNLTVLPPGKAQCPFHSHRGEEEMFLILEGEGELRFGDQRHRIRKHDVIACPTGGPEVAHQIINTGSVEMRYLALSNLVDIEACEYPDSNKVGVWANEPGAPALRKLFRAESTVEYYDGEGAE